MTNKPHRYLSLTETARRFAISPKALRLYEARNLVIPERTPAGWRVYGPPQITRLNRSSPSKALACRWGVLAS